MKKVKVLIIEPSQKIYTKEINFTEDIYGLIYAPLKIVKAFDNIYYIYSEEATKTKEKIFKRNFKICKDEVYGNIVVVAKKDNEYISLSNAQIKAVKEIFDI